MRTVLGCLCGERNIAVKYELRPYQLDAIQDLRDRIASGMRAPICVAPTGAGKTLLEAELVRAHLSKSADNRVLVIAHRRELISQIASTLLRHDVTDIGIIMPGAQPRPSARVQVASTQTLRARKHLPPATLVIADEAHHYTSDDWSLIIQHYDAVLRVGFTATPCRSDGRGMSPSFDSMVIVSTIKELTATGYLVPCRVIACDPLSKGELSHSPVDAYLAHANGMRTVVFADFVSNAEKFRDEFLAAGIPAEVIHGKLKDDERKRALAGHAAGAVLINCMVLTEGWDSPQTTCCILARGCGSVGTYLQIVGRVLRPYPGKEEALLIDLTGRSYDKHGPPDADRIYALKGKGIRRKGEGEDDLYCPVCGGSIEPPPNSWPCEGCGYEKQGQVEAPTYTGDQLTERYAAKRQEDDSKRIETLSRWIAEARDKGHKPGAAISKYTAVYKGAPPAHVLSAAGELARDKKCVRCVGCERVVAKTYGGDMCWQCAQKKSDESAVAVLTEEEDRRARKRALKAERYKNDPEMRAKKIARELKRQSTPEYKAKRKAMHAERRKSASFIEMLRARAAKRRNSPDYKEKQRERDAKHKKNPEYKEKERERSAKRRQSPEYKEKNRKRSAELRKRKKEELAQQKKAAE